MPFLAQHQDSEKAEAQDMQERSKTGSSVEASKILVLFMSVLFAHMSFRRLTVMDFKVHKDHYFDQLI